MSELFELMEQLNREEEFQLVEMQKHFAEQDLKHKDLKKMLDFYKGWQVFFFTNLKLLWKNNNMNQTFFHRWNSKTHGQYYEKFRQIGIEQTYNWEGPWANWKFHWFANISGTA